MSQMLEYAQKYAALGWQVFPCLPQQKIPATPHGVKDATADPEQIRAWWSKNPNFNIAVACGVESGIHVVDVDVQESTGVSGWDSLAKFVESGNTLPETIRQNTPRGGAHFLYRTTVPPANRNGFVPGVDIRSTGYYVVLAPSVHANGGRYAWAPGCAPWECEAAEYPAFMRPTIRAPWAAPPTPPAQATAIATVPPTSDILRRASLYLAECDPAVQGCGGHDKLLWAAVAMVHGLGLSDGQAYDLLAREYNPRCVPPWDLSQPKEEADFRRKITEARKLVPGKPSGWLLDDTAYAPVDPDKLMSDADIDRMLANSAQSPAETPSAPPPQPIPGKELQFLTRPTGLLGQVCSWINATALKEQPFLTLGCSLAFLGALFGRKVKDELGSRTNLYCMGVAPSSAGKAHAMNQIRRICEAAGCVDLLGGDDIASDSAIEERMDRAAATLFLWDEVGYMLTHIKSGVSQHHAKVVPLLMKLYSAAGSIYKGREYADSERQRTIVQPCCCIYGTSTPERFCSGIRPEELQDGWLSRCLVFYSPISPAKSRGRREAEVPAEIREQVQAWWVREIAGAGNVSDAFDRRATNDKERPPIQIIVPATAEAEALFVKFDAETAEYGRSKPQLACLWGKGEENARRIALILAAGESFEAPVITPAIADYACRLVRYLLEDFGRTIAPEIVTCETDARKRKLIAIIETGGVRGCLKRDLTRATQWLRFKERSDLLADLIEAGEIVSQAKPEGKGVFFWTIDNFLKFTAQEEKQ